MQTKQIAILCIIIFIISFFAGFEFGVSSTIKKIVDVASRFMVIDENLVRQAITQYQNNIGGTYPVLNGTCLYNNSGN